MNDGCRVCPRTVALAVREASQERHRAVALVQVSKSRLFVVSLCSAGEFICTCGEHVAAKAAHVTLSLKCQVPHLLLAPCPEAIGVTFLWRGAADCSRDRLPHQVLQPHHVCFYFPVRLFGRGSELIPSSGKGKLSASVNKGKRIPFRLLLLLHMSLCSHSAPSVRSGMPHRGETATRPSSRRIRRATIPTMAVKVG